VCVEGERERERDVNDGGGGDYVDDVGVVRWEEKEVK
jgi:hypothetical protein